MSTHSEHVVRINGVESGLMHHDLSAVFRSHDASSWSHDLRSGSPDAVMLPKADSVEHIAEVCVHVEEKKLNFSIDSTLLIQDPFLYFSTLLIQDPFLYFSTLPMQDPFPYFSTLPIQDPFLYFSTLPT